MSAAAHDLRTYDPRAERTRTAVCDLSTFSTDQSAAPWTLSEREVSPQVSPPAGVARTSGSLTGGDSGGTRPTGVAPSRSESVLSAHSAYRDQRAPWGQSSQRAEA